MVKVPRFDAIEVEGFLSSSCPTPPPCAAPSWSSSASSGGGGIPSSSSSRGATVCLAMIVSLMTSVYLTALPTERWPAYLVITIGACTPGKEVF
uniref:Uncharacterized protein n=1 Tax=Oryza barthii TaxID=65489 RepID=A0A0D3GNA7_9ORYZ